MEEVRDSVTTESTATRGFDVTAPFEIRIPHPEYQDKKKCKLRFPSDEEWSARARHQITVRRSLGRDASRTEVLNSAESDAQLFAKIRQDKDGDPFDEAEISRAISQIETARIIETVRDGNQYRITLKVPKATVVHTLKIPTQKQIMDFGKAAVHTTGRRNAIETRVALEPSADLWGRLDPKVEGYAGAVPIIHKDIALTELLTLVHLDTDDDDLDS